MDFRYHHSVIVLHQWDLPMKTTKLREDMSKFEFLRDFLDSEEGLRLPTHQREMLEQLDKSGCTVSMLLGRKPITAKEISKLADTVRKR